MKACRTCCGRKLTRPVVESQGGVVCATQRRVAAINLGGERRREGMPELAQLKVLRSNEEEGVHGEAWAPEASDREREER